MKKFFFISVLCISTLCSHAQFYQGCGIFVGATAGRQKWDDNGIKSKSKYLLRYNAEFFCEFINNPTFRWVTELQYNVKGAKWDSAGTKIKYANQYVAWNNYLMVRKEMYAIIPYAKIGPRLEYVFSTPQSFSRFHVTGALGAGVEFVAFGPIKFITEAWWVPDLTHSYDANNFMIKQHCWELRIGIKFGQAGANTCPAYRDDNQGG